MAFESLWMCQTVLFLLLLKCNHNLLLNCINNKLLDSLWTGIRLKNIYSTEQGPWSKKKNIFPQVLEKEDDLPDERCLLGNFWIWLYQVEAYLWCYPVEGRGHIVIFSLWHFNIWILWPWAKCHHQLSFHKEKKEIREIIQPVWIHTFPEFSIILLKNNPNEHWF